MSVYVNDYPYERWMENLPELLTKLPLNCLALPGSHDSFTSNISSSSATAPDAEAVVKRLTSLFGRLAKAIIARWARAQGLGTLAQLRCGVRYLDIRVARNDKAKGELYSCHSLFGSVIREELLLVNDFLSLNPQEVILLDFNHFYNMDKADHWRLLRQLETVFGARLVPYTGDLIPSLNSLWATSGRVFVFYHRSDMDAARDFLWPGRCIPSPWPNTNEMATLALFWDRSYNGGRNSATFQVMQGVLTPRTKDIILGVWSSLEKRMADVAGPAFADWLQRDKRAGPGNLNCSIVDFADRYNYVAAVMQVNMNTASQLQKIAG